MKTQLLTIEELLTLGFQELEGDTLDDVGYYKWWVFYKNESELHITYEYKNNGDFVLGYVELNGEELKGRELQKTDINFLIGIM